MSLSEFQRMRRLVLAGMIVLAFAALLAVRSRWSHDVHEAIEHAGRALIVLGILGRAWCTLYIGGRKAREIVSDGPYSVTRNPLYLFSAIAAFGVGAQTGSLAVGALFLAGCLVAFAVVVRREEAHLSATFGAPYDDYRALVPRFWPDLRRFQDRSVLSVPASRLYRTLGDGVLFLVSVPAFEAVEHLQNAGLVPVSLQLF